MNKRTFKTITVFCLIAIICLLVTACGTQTQSESADEVAQEEVASAPTEVEEEQSAEEVEVEEEEVVEEEVDHLAELAEAAKSEEGVIKSYGMPETWANYGKIFGNFYDLYGIENQDIDMGSSVVFSRMTEENASQNDIADVQAIFALQIADEGLFDTYKISCWDDLPEGQKGEGPDGSVWQAAYKGTLGWLVNTDIIEDVPYTWEDLKDPALKGMISYLDPRATGTGVLTVEAVSYAVSGDPFDYEAGSEFLAELHELGNIASVDPKVDISKFQRGEIGVLINFDYNLLNWKDTLDIPAEVVIPSDGSAATAYTVNVARNAPNLSTGRLFLEYLICGEGQTLYAEQYVSPINPNVELPDDIAAKFPSDEMYENVVFPDYVKSGEVLEDLKTAWANAVGAQ